MFSLINADCKIKEGKYCKTSLQFFFELLCVMYFSLAFEHGYLSTMVCFDEYNIVKK